ncbi:MAG: outer membrane beta-barrel protein [Pseudomonadota bacterium]
MTIKKLALAALVATSAFSAFADDDEKVNFAELNMGTAMSASTGGNVKSAGTSYFPGLEVGTRVNEFFRAGLSFTYKPKFSVKYNTVPAGYVFNNAKMISYSVLANMYIDVGEFNKFKPYMVVGAGVAKNKTKNTSYTGTTTGSFAGSSKTNFAYRAGLGTQYVINEEFNIDVRYQYEDMGKFETASFKNTTYNGKLKANEFLLGVAYNF